MRLKRLYPILLVALFGFATGARASTVFVNGSFEADSTTGFQHVSTLTGWTVFSTGAPPYLINNATYGNTPYGNQFLALGGIEDNASSYIEQTVTGFNVGDTYQLSWAQSSEFTSSDELMVSFTTGSSTPGQIFTSAPFPGGSEFWFTWQTMTMDFIPDAGAVTFHLQGVPNSGSYEVGVDNFQLTDLTGSTVPEPSSVTLFGTGLIGLVGLLRKNWRGRDGKSVVAY